MPTNINFLSIALKVGGKDLVLESNSFGAAANDTTANLKTSITTALAAGIDLKQQKGSILSVNVGDFVTWVETTLSGDGANLKTDLNTFLNNVKDPSKGALNGMTIDLWDLAISAKKPSGATVQFSFTFSLRLDLNPTFYSGLLGADVAAKIGSILTIQSIGFGMTYKSA